MKNNLNVTVIIVCYNEEKNIKDCILSLINNKYNLGVFDILVVDGMSTDETLNIIESIKKTSDIEINVINNPERFISSSRQLGVEKSKNDIILFTDADCLVPYDWIQIMVSGYLKYKEEYKIAGVGGSNIPPKIKDTKKQNFYNALGVMLNSFIGSRGSVQGLVLKEDKVIDHIPCVNVLYNKKIIEEVDGFDKSFANIGEDQDLTFRINNLGYKFVYLKDSFVYHKLRPNLNKWIKNMYLYGKGRVWLIKKHIKMLNVFFIAPIILLLSFFYMPFFKIYFYIPLYYFIFIFLYSYKIHPTKKLKNVFFVFILFVSTHISYAIGEIVGLCSSRFQQKL